MTSNYATEGSAGASFARVTAAPEFQTGVRQRGTNSRDYIYVRASGAIAAGASCKVSQGVDVWQAVSGPGQHVADVAFPDGAHGWVRQRFSLPDEAGEVDFDDASTGWGVADLQAAIEHINDNFSLTTHTHALDALSDVSVAGASVNEVVSWNGSAWVAAAPVSTMGSLSDVTLASLAANDTVVWNGSNWENQPENAHPHTLSDITDSGTLASLDSVNNGNWSGTDLAVANGGTGASAAGDARTNLGVAIGSDVQAHDAVLDSLSGNADASGTLEKTGADTVGTYTVTAAGKALLDDASAGAQRTTLGLGALAVEDSVGTALLDNNAVTNVELADMADSTFKMRAAGSGTGNPIDGTAAQARAAMSLGDLALLDSVAASQIDAGAVGTSGLADDCVTLDKLEHGTRGDILYYGASGVPARLGFGTSGQLLQTNGSGADPSWVSPAALTDGDKGDITVSSAGTVWTIDAGAVDTTALADNGVTLAKLEHGTSGDILYYGTSGTPSRLAKGTDGQVLGLASGLPAWQDAGGGVPVGTVVAYAGASAPTDYLFCFGQNVSRTTYADLFSAIGTIHGAGDGSTTFGIPDLRGRVVAGQDDMGGSSADRLTGASGGVDGDTLGGTGGAQTHTLTVAQMPAHDHGTNIALSSAGLTYKEINTTGGDSEITTGSTGGGGAHNNVQPTIILNYIIYAGA